MFTKEFRVWGYYDGDVLNRQRESFCNSYKHDFSENGKTRIIEVLNSDKTNTNMFSIVIITRDTLKECYDEFFAQLTDGIFENSRYGLVEENLNDEWEEMECVCL